MPVVSNMGGNDIDVEIIRYIFKLADPSGLVRLVSRIWQEYHTIPIL